MKCKKCNKWELPIYVYIYSEKPLLNTNDIEMILRCPLCNEENKLNMTLKEKILTE